jgi:dolichol kinase
MVTISGEWKMAKVADEWRSKLIMEIRRKLIHTTGLMVPFGILAFGRIFTAAAILLALIMAVFLEAGRLKGMIKLPEVREHEEAKVAGYFYYILGSLLTVAIFKPAISIAAMLMLSLGDAISGIIGSMLENSNVRSGDKGWRIKPLPITLGMFMTCILVGHASSGITGLPFEVYLAGAIGATMADGISVFIRNRVVDDNLTIPIVAGTAMSIVALA